MGRWKYICKKGLVAGSLWLLAGLTACTDGFDSLSPQGNLSLRLVAIRLDEQPGAKELTRAAAGEVDEETINHLWVLQFDGTDDSALLTGKTDYTGAAVNPSNQTLRDLLVGTGQTLCFLANCNIDAVRNFSIGATLGDFKQLSLSVPDEASLFPVAGYIPMLGEWKGEVKSNADGSSPIVATVQMERTVAKIDLTVKTSLPAGDAFRVSSVRLYHVPDKMWLTAAAADPFPVAEFNLLDEYGTTTAVGNPPVTVRWYMPENRRGLGTATVSTDKTAANLNAAATGQGDKATYVEIVGDYTSGDNQTFVAIYRNYLGGNSTTDYNIRRNSAYAIDLTIRGKNTSDSRIKVYGQAYTSVIDPDEVNLDVNSVPVLDGVKTVRQTGLNQAEAASTLTVDGKVTARGFVWSSTINSETGLVWGASDVGQVIETGSFTSGAYESVLTNLTPGTTYYIRAAASNSLGTGYGPITTFTTPELRPAANCQLVVPGGTVMFEPKDAAGNLKDIDAVSLAWQTRDAGTTSGNLPLLKAADLIYDAANGAIIVHTNPAVSAANAVLAGTKNGGAVWYWHLWVTPYVPTGTISGTNRSEAVVQGRIQTYDSKYVAAAGNGVAIMDRDLGSQALSTILSASQAVNDPSFHFGLLYQWGYALPWVPSQRHSTTQAVPVYGINGYEVSPPAYQTVAVANNAWNTNKTASDPCPPGWRVAPAGAFGDLANYGVFPANNVQPDGGRLYIQGGVNAWFFANGWRTGGGNSNFTSAGMGGVWTSGYGKALTFDTSVENKIDPAADVAVLSALPVRCVQNK